MFRLTLSDGYRIPEFAQIFLRDALRPINEAMQAVFERAMAKGTMRKADTEFAARELFAPYFHSVLIMTILCFDRSEMWQSREYLDHALVSFCRSYEITD